MSDRGKVEKTLRMIRIRQAVRRACDAMGLGSRLIPMLILALVVAGLMFGVAIAAGLSTSSVMGTPLVSFLVVAGAGLFLVGTATDEGLTKAAESLESELRRIEAEPPPPPVPPVEAPRAASGPAPAPPAPKRPTPAPSPAPAAASAKPSPVPQAPARAPSPPAVASVDQRNVVADILGYDPLARCAEHPQQSKEVTLMDDFDSSWVAGGGEFQEEMRLLTDGLKPEINDSGHPGYWMMAKLIQEEVRPAGWESVTFFGSPVAIGTRPIRVVVKGKTIGFLKQSEGLAHRKKMDARGLTGQTVELPVRIYPPADWMKDPGYGAFVYLPNVYCAYMDPPEPEKPRKPRSKPDPKADLSDSAGKVVPLWSPSDMALWVSGQRSSALNDELTRYVRGCDLYQGSIRSIAGRLKPVRYHSPAKRYEFDGRTVEIPSFTGHEQLMTVAELHIDDQPPANRDQIRLNRKHVIEVGNKPIRVTIDGETVGFFEAAEGQYHRKKLRECGIGGAIAQVPAEIRNTVIYDLDGTEIPILSVQVHLPKVYKA
jgi:hypothetical protein